ncbi:cellulose-binding domain-containing protein [Heterostelium album PN500]|uniref:Cellulose-binding domain-containing protein n=1 Tax=Heterostelium pallidum (strain ATCC 26659 / Pp 5 / PN500) TaxID=670386 RepID=D3BQ14_HETP5|nr:cellulose-binding domain-containing protein [Heterostelium album PN500]EFA76565.1 cellulose-binding domain-containing protein [Heterostelium album PN500]|eukprot:XP_020428697.1 cellulose-binding domain-containing protein [Heterostelium album PN500]
MTLGGVIPCSTQLKPVFNAALGYQCITVSGNGLASDGTLIGYRGSLMYNRYYNAIRQQSAIPFVKSSDYVCNPHNNRVQPYLVDQAKQYSEFNIYANGSVQLGTDVVPLVCLQEHAGAYSFNYNGAAYYFVLIINSLPAGCPAVHFGESCNGTTTPTPTSTPTSTPAPSNTTFKVTATNNWVNGNDNFTQYSVDIKNGGTTDITSLVISATNFNASSKWNIESLTNGDLTLPSYATIPAGGTFTFGFITTSSVIPSFAVKN